MSKKSILAILALAALFPNFASADSTPPKPPKEVPIDPAPTTVIPHTPGFENEVSGLLADGLLTITFAEPEGMATVILSENGTATIYRGYHHTASPIIISAPDCAAPVLIQISTQEGNQYEGWID